MSVNLLRSIRYRFGWARYYLDWRYGDHCKKCALRHVWRAEIPTNARDAFEKGQLFRTDVSRLCRAKVLVPLYDERGLVVLDPGEPLMPIDCLPYGKMPEYGANQQPSTES